MTGILLVGHGSRDEGANAEFQTLVGHFRQYRPDLRVEVGHVELARPSLDEAFEALASSTDHVLVVPVMFFMAGHVKHDLFLAAEAARRRHPGLKVEHAYPLGIHPDLTALTWQRAQEAMPLDAGTNATTGVVFVGRGSSDPDANGDLCKTARLFGEGRGFGLVQPAFMGITTPRVPEALELAARLRPETLLVVPYLLFAGRLMTRLEQDVQAFGEQHPWIRVRMARHLGPAPLLCRLIDERLRAAGSGMAVLPCDNCQYRVAFPGSESSVGGLRAMLWSQRHRFTHSQAAPHVHAHQPLQKHVLVCANADCADRGSLALISELRRGLKAAGRHKEIRVTRTSCMGRCGEGPAMAVYPDGIWYREVQSADAPELIREHLLNDRLVSRLVDTILQ